MRELIAVAVALVVASATPAMATVVPDLPVPEPTTLSLVSGGVALVVVGARWLRRK